METMLLELVGIAPQLALTVVVVYFVMKRDDVWRACFKEATSEYKSLVERLEVVLITATEVMARLAVVTEVRQDLSKEFVREMISELRSALASD